MKKNLFLCLFAALCTMGTFTACSSDDESGVITPAAADVTGNYKGNLDVMVDAANLPTVENQLVSVTKAGESTVSLSISDFSFMGISIGDINLNECQLSGSGDKYTFTGTTKVNAAILTADVDAEGTFEGDKLTINMDIAASLGSVKQTVKVVYTGTKLTGSESSEAKILSFVFDQEVSAANAVVLEQPVVDETAKTIKFAVSADATSDDLSKLMPTIEVSEKATVTPASGAVQDFSNGKTVTYTVTAENGTKVTYTASVYGNVTSYDFENWSYDTSMYPEENQIYMANGWASCNNAVALIKYMGALGGITYTGEYPIRPSDDAFTGEKAVLLESVDTQGGNIFGQKVPKVTAASIFLGSFNAMAAISDPMATTSFGIMYDKQPLKVTGYYKYTPGTEFYNANGELQEGVTDKCAMSAVLYEVSSEDETLNGSNIYTSDKIVAKAVFTSDKSVDTYTPFELNLEYAKAYDSSKKYKFAIIFSASADGASYNAAVGSKLLIDNVSVVNQN
ncbi:PCMD domain-containing protein [Phocaeicola sp.]|uniref:PCMD domain-containing protein n=1 Tax=Phocaeicola sp. TaxID=2773926 RepID=UPI0030782441